MADVPVSNIPALLTFLLSDNQAVGGVSSSTSYPLNGISQANSRFYFKVTDFNGDPVYENPAFDAVPVYTDPDVAGSSGTTWLNDFIALPTGSDNKVIKGAYTVYLKQRDNSGVETDIFTQNFTLNFQYESPVLVFERLIQLFNPPLLSVTDQTSYTIKDQQSGAQVNPTTQTRAWYLYYPPVLQFSPITSTAVSVQTNNVWSGHYQVKLDVSVLYTLNTTLSNCDFIISDAPTLLDDFEVPDTSRNRFYCCLKHAEERYYNSIGTQAEQENLQMFQTVCSYEILIETAIQNGNYDDVVTYIDRAREISGCDDDCECNEDDTPEPLTGWGTQNIVDKIEEIADGLNSVFPTSQSDKNKLKNKSFTNNDVDIKDEGVSIPETSSGIAAKASFSSSAGEFTLNYTPAAGNRITIPIYK